MLRRGDSDVAYGEMVRPSRGLSLTPMEPLEIVLLSPPETDLPAQVQIEHIGKIPMICPPPSEERRRLLDAPLAAMGLKMNVVLESDDPTTRSEEHTSELQSLMRISYAVFCLKKKKKKHNT